MLVTYLIQGSAEQLLSQSPPPGPSLWLSYDRSVQIEGSVECLFAASSTWAEGRNLLLDRAIKIAPAEYYIFCDDDIRFLSGSYPALEDWLARSRPALGFPTTEKALYGRTYRADLDVQRAVTIDEQIYAVHRSFVGVRGIAPLETAYDEVSWYAASYIFEYLAAEVYGPLSHQYNRLVVANDRHVWEAGGNAYARGRGDFNKTRDLVVAHLERMLGRFDPGVIEQLMSGRSEADIAAARERRMARLEQLNRLASAEKVAR